MATTSIIVALLLGLGLAASTGLNTFLPLLVLAASAKFGIAGISLGERFEWLSSDVAIVVLIVASIVEIAADKIPAVDHVLDSVGTFIRPVAGALAAASVLTGLDPVVASILGIIVGGPTSLGFHTMKAGARVASSATTFGCANPVISLVEDILSVGLTIIAMFMPLIVPLVLALFVFVLWRAMERMRRPTTPPLAG